MIFHRKNFNGKARIGQAKPHTLDEAKALNSRTIDFLNGHGKKYEKNKPLKENMWGEKHEKLDNHDRKTSTIQVSSCFPCWMTGGMRRTQGRSRSQKPQPMSPVPSMTIPEELNRTFCGQFSVVTYGKNKIDKYRNRLFQKYHRFFEGKLENLANRILKTHVLVVSNTMCVWKSSCLTVSWETRSRSEVELGSFCHFFKCFLEIIQDTREATASLIRTAFERFKKLGASTGLRRQASKAFDMLGAVWFVESWLHCHPRPQRCSSKCIARSRQTCSNSSLARQIVSGIGRTQLPQKKKIRAIKSFHFFSFVFFGVDNNKLVSFLSIGFIKFESVCLRFNRRID